VAYHTRTELLQALGEHVLVAIDGDVKLAFRRHLGALARLEAVLRVNGEVRYGGEEIWVVPLGAIVRREHPRFAPLRRAQLEQALLEPRRRRRPAAPRDGQRSRLYAWEEEILAPRAPDEQLTLKECQELADRLLEETGLALGVEVRDGGHSGSARWLPGTRFAGRIKLPRGCRQPWVLLHEMAHVLCDHRYVSPEGTPTVAAHGPEFVRTYLDLLERYVGLPVCELERAARRAGLRVSPPESSAYMTPGMRLALAHQALSAVERRVFRQALRRQGKDPPRVQPPGRQGWLF
jgi:hypothetical protein